MSRRLPVYLLLDTSASMRGAPIEAVQEGLQALLSALRRDPHALETAYLSVITFGSKAQELSPLVEVTAFKTPTIAASGATSMGAALTLLSQTIERDVIRGTAERRGDWKPLVFLMTDGGPTDDWRRGKADLDKVPIATLVACAAGAQADTSVLRELTEAVVTLDTADAATIQSFFAWVSASVAMTSQKVDLTKRDIGGLGDLPPPPPEVNVAGV
jgi:uncharacterized protein YegL